MATHRLTPAKIMQLGAGFMGSKALLSAIELGLFTELAKGPQTLEALMARLQLHSRSAHDFFDALVALGMLKRTGTRYANTPETALFLDRNKPSYMGGILEMANARLYPFWGTLTDGLRTGQPQNEVKTGGDFFGTLYADSQRLEGFLRAMTGLSIGTAQVIAKKFPWKKYKTFVDVGCAQGGVAQRLRFHPGDFFKDPLPTCDVIIMGHILHDWNLDEKRMLLRKAYDVLSPKGAIIVHEALIDDARKQNAFGLLMSLNMLIETPGGFDFTGADCRTWMKEAGFKRTQVTRLAGPDSMVVGFK